MDASVSPDPPLSLDREWGRLEGRVESLEAAVEKLEAAVRSLLSIVDFGNRAIRLVYGAIGLIGLDGLARVCIALAHAMGMPQ